MEESINPIVQNTTNPEPNNSQKSIAGAIIVAGFIIAGAILIKGNGTPITTTTPLMPNYKDIQLAPVSASDQVLGDPNASVTLVVYEDFQCPWCGKIHKEAEKALREKYLPTGKVNLVYRDFSFLGTFVNPYVASKDESSNAAQAARCAGDQGKFWEYHDYLFDHQNGENKGNFSVPNLKSFARILTLDTASFNQCLDSNKYLPAVNASNDQGKIAGVQGTPKGFILKKGKIVDTIDGYMPSEQVTAKIDQALK